MNETGHPRGDTGPFELDDARLGFQVAERRAALASREIYSRFGAMLTTHSIIIAILGWILTSEHRLPPVLGIALPIVGLLLCGLWWLFNIHGLYYQGLFMQEALRLETRFLVVSLAYSSKFITENGFAVGEGLKGAQTVCRPLHG